MLFQFDLFVLSFQSSITEDCARPDSRQNGNFGPSECGSTNMSDDAALLLGTDVVSGRITMLDSSPFAPCTVIRRTSPPP